MGSRLGLIAASLVLCVLGAACGGSSSRRATPSAAPVAVATPISPPVAPVATGTVAPMLRSAGWLVYLRGGDLYAGDLRDGREVPLTSGGLGAGFVGWSGSGEATTVYYATLIERAPQNARSIGTARVSRRPAHGKSHAEDLFTFSPPAASADGEPLAHAARVAPDGGAVAYADDAGVHRYDIVSGARSLLLANPCQSEPRPEKGCASYVNPQWSPDGRWVLASKLLYEGSISVVVDAGDPASVREFTDVGGDVQAWAPDSRYFCAFNEVFAPGGAHIISPVDGSIAPLPPGLAQATGVRTCAWDDSRHAGDRGRHRRQQRCGPGRGVRHVGIRVRQRGDPAGSVVRGSRRLAAGFAALWARADRAGRSAVRRGVRRAATGRGGAVRTRRLLPRTAVRSLHCVRGWRCRYDPALAWPRQLAQP